MATDSPTEAVQETNGTTESTASTTLPLRQHPSEIRFDIVATYHNHLKRDPKLTKPVAAIVSLVDLLNAYPFTTVFETLETVKLHRDRLRDSVQNPVPLLAGTDLFLQYLLTSLKRQERQREGQDSQQQRRPRDSFDTVRQHLLRSGRLFVARAIDARAGVAKRAARFVDEGKTVMTYGNSRTVRAVLEQAAASRSKGSFRVVYVADETDAARSHAFVAALRACGIPVAEVPLAAVAHVVYLPGKVDALMLGAEAVMHNGGIISRIGTFQIAKLAKPRVPVYVTTESHKFSRKFTMDQRDLGFDQQLLDFSTEEAPSRQPFDEAVDYTPPELITNFITEQGVHQPDSVIYRIMDIYGADSFNST